jgi:hypothetical protein
MPLLINLAMSKIVTNIVLLGIIDLGTGQLEGLSSFLIPLNNSGVSCFDGKCASISSRAAKLSP